MQCQLYLCTTCHDFLRAIVCCQSNPIHVARAGGVFCYVYFVFRGCGFAPCSSAVLPFWNHIMQMGIQYTFWSSLSLPPASRTGWAVCCRILGLKRRWTMHGYHWQTALHLPKKWRIFSMLKSYEISKVSMANILVLVVKKVDMSFLSALITSIPWVTNRLGRSLLAWYLLSVSTFPRICDISRKICFYLV